MGLWSEVKKLQNASRMSPTIIDGQCDSKDIAESLGNKYKELYNSVPSDAIILEELCTTVKSEMLSSRECDFAVSIDEINQAIAKIKERKK